jgi:hypothetical protein
MSVDGELQNEMNVIHVITEKSRDYRTGLSDFKPNRRTFDRKRV